MSSKRIRRPKKNNNVTVYAGTAVFATSIFGDRAAMKYASTKTNKGALRRLDAAEVELTYSIGKSAEVDEPKREEGTMKIGRKVHNNTKNQTSEKRHNSFINHLCHYTTTTTSSFLVLTA